MLSLYVTTVTKLLSMDKLRCALRSGAGAVKWADLDAALAGQGDCPAMEQQPSVALENAELWRTFHALCNEMVITRAGRSVIDLLFVHEGVSPLAHVCAQAYVPIARHLHSWTAALGGILHFVRAASLERV